MGIKLLKMLSLITIIWVTLLIGERAYWGTRGFLYPDTWRKLENDFKQKSNDYLINKLNSMSFEIAEVAENVLADRKEKKAVPYILKFLRSPMKYKRHSAIRALGAIGDQRAIMPLMQIINQGEKHPDYIEALRALALMHYSDIYSKVVELATLDPKLDFQDYRSSGITMLESFGNKDAIPILQKIAISDPKEYIRDKAKNAIEHINRES